MRSRTGNDIGRIAKRLSATRLLHVVVLGNSPNVFELVHRVSTESLARGALVLAGPALLSRGRAHQQEPVQERPPGKAAPHPRLRELGAQRQA